MTRRDARHPQLPDEDSAAVPLPGVHCMRSAAHTLSAEALIERLGLQPHPEGGFFAETWHGVADAAPPGNPGGERWSTPPHESPSPKGDTRQFGSAIYYLLTPDTFSALHRLDADEIYHFYLGDPIDLTLLRAGGPAQTVTLGPDLLAGHHVQFVVPRGTWQGSRLRSGGRFALLGTTMAPGWAPAGFVMGQRAELVAAWPAAQALIERLTRQ